MIDARSEGRATTVTFAVLTIAASSDSSHANGGLDLRDEQHKSGSSEDAAVSEEAVVASEKKSQLE